jgi:hypothetical protein
MSPNVCRVPAKKERNLSEEEQIVNKAGDLSKRSTLEKWFRLDYS